MSHYNPRVYNYKNLNDEDKRMVKGFIYMMNSVENMKEDFELDIEIEFLKKPFYQTAEFVINQAMQHMTNDIVEFIVSRIDSYDGEVEEYDTDDYLYGLE